MRNCKAFPLNEWTCVVWAHRHLYQKSCTAHTLKAFLPVEHVTLELRSFCAGELTLHADERFSPKWISMCVLKLLVSEQEKFHCVQLKGFFSWMGEDVTFQVTGLCAGKVALFANKRLLSSINQHVSFKLKSTDAWVSAVVSTMRLLSNMMKQVHFQVSCHFEGEITLNTWVRFVFSLHFQCTKFSV